MRKILEILAHLDRIQGKRFTAIELDLRLDLERAIREALGDVDRLGEVLAACDSYRGRHDFGDGLP